MNCWPMSPAISGWMPMMFIARVSCRPERVMPSRRRPRQRLHQEVGSAHSGLDRSKRVLNRLASLAHLFGMLVEPALHCFENILMLPPGDASLFACGAGALDGTALAGVGPVPA